ncbi:VCBS repeat-containing protein [Chondrinema litorale]|uniref:VCBS repeat-containing protein n=1 Tax=Chondrinema litorale TaxID=2994555 RepID=UPI002543AC53|nr:VCBS repeat-containing protein [Chondrinema litorale]UZR93695.1 VCBS repeat-containing protein [Chondrinema litorale]
MKLSITTIKQDFIIPLTLCCLLSCNQKYDGFQQFRLIKGDEANLLFKNTIEELDTLNTLNYAYIYNGAGVGVADINNDGLQDIYFAGNQVSSKLYLNKGNLQFEDISEKAGVTTDRWCTGVSMVDINTDGFVDIYVCAADRNYTDKARNLLFINNGDNTFTESAKEYGLDDKGYSTQAAFLDYDLDGDLDLYLLTNGTEDFPPNNVRPVKKDGKGISTDRLYKNNAVECASNSELCVSKFTDVSKEAGILIEGYGLGVAVADINQDGYPDVYCSNDFISNDLLWINNGDGTFTDHLKEYTKQTTYNGMGVDIADFNNDNLPDIVEMDMLPEDNQHTKTMLMPMNYDKYQMKIQMGYQHQFFRNTLQMNTGSGSFSEVGRLSGISRTDWSWAPLFVDMDNDGYRDLFISNGYGRDVTDLDFVVYGLQGDYTYGDKSQDVTKHFKQIQELSGIHVSNYFYKNQGDLTFKDQSKEWRVDSPSYSNGAAFADLDNDGDVDFITNNINDYPFIYTNLEDQNPNKNNFLRVALIGPKLNENGLGVKLWLEDESIQLFHEHYIVRGYKSTVENTIHFGLGDVQNVKSLSIRWPDGKTQKLSNIQVNQKVEINYKDAISNSRKETEQSKTLFSAVTASQTPKFIHQENYNIDFKTQPLLHHMNSRTGPGIAVGDVNNDGLQDFYVGGASGQNGILYLQEKTNSRSIPAFTEKVIDETFIKSEDTGCLFFDADNDGDLDLFIASGGAIFFADGEFSNLYQDRLYTNDGNGNFKLNEGALPILNGSSSSVVAADYDKDGDLDLFIGGKLDPKRYPESGKSYLLQNNGGVFKDVTNEVSELQRIGMVSSAIWTDFNNDSWIDLIVVGEWMPITFFENKNGVLTNITGQTNLAESYGWWNSINAGDFDADGDIDYIVGNLGTNSVLKASVKEPVELYAKDFDKSGNIDPILFHYTQGKSYPFAMRDALIDQINGMKGRFKEYKLYGQATVNEIFRDKELDGATHLKTTVLSNSFIENLGNNQFKIKPLPNAAQIAPMYGSQISDFNTDGFLDILLVGNNTNVETLFGFYDASEGVLLAGDGSNNFKVIDAKATGLKITGNARGLVQLTLDENNSMLICAKNNELLQFVQSVYSKGKLISLKHNDVYAEVFFKNSDKKQRVEFYYGAGYFSQGERSYFLNENISQMIIYDSKGNSRKVMQETL